MRNTNTPIPRPSSVIRRWPPAPSPRNTAWSVMSGSTGKPVNWLTISKMLMLQFYRVARRVPQVSRLTRRRNWRGREVVRLRQSWFQPLEMVCLLTMEAAPRIFSVSGKDRSAVAMAGQTGKAFWFSTDNGDFITSRYYYDAYPDWARRWNSQRNSEKYAGTEWALSSGYGPPTCWPGRMTVPMRRT